MFRVAWISALFLALVGSLDLKAGDSKDTWKGTHAVFEFGPTWRTASIPSRPEIPNTIGGHFGAGLRKSFGKVLFIGMGAEMGITTQTESRQNATIGDWSGTEYHPLVPALGFRLGNLQLVFGYPMFGKLVLLSKTSNDEVVKYSGGSFLQGSLFFETSSGLFGCQYRKGTFKRETTGSTSADLDPAMKISSFSILFGFPLF